MQDTDRPPKRWAQNFFVSFPPGAGGLSPVEVDELRGILDDARMQQGRTENRTTSSIRTGKTQWIRSGEADPAIFSHLYTLAVVANRELDWNFDFTGPAPALQATSYSADGEEHYDWHMDWGTGRLKYRKVTVVASLSEPQDFEGGSLELTIGSTPVEAPKGAGNVTVFPSFLLHRVTPVTSGRRLGVVSWMLGDPFT